MKKITFLPFLFVVCFATAQEQTIELLSIFSRPDTVICQGDTLAGLFFRVEKISIENGTDYPNTSIDTSLYMNGVCPADSLEVLRQIRRDAQDIQQRASGVMSNAFERVRRGNAEYQEIRSVHNAFAGEDIYLYFESIFPGPYGGVYRILDVQAGTSVLADFVRVGAADRYRLEVQAGEPGAGTRYTVIPFTASSFQINQWTPAGGTAANFKMFKDRGTDNAKPVFRENGFLEGGTEDQLRIVKIR